VLSALNVNIKKCCFYSQKVIPALTVKMKECCFHSQNIEALTSKLCFNSCYQATFTSKGTPIIVIEKLRNHHVNT